nr:hypothetical protein [Tanacetum cinerariifolium]
AFISSLNHNSETSEVPTIQGAFTASAQVPIYEDISQINDDDDIEEMDIKWNLALLSMRADMFWQKTGKKITIQGSNVAGFDKPKVECFNFYNMGHFARECRSPRSQDRGKRESYKKDPKEDEALKNHALVADEEEAPTEYALMLKVIERDIELKDNKIKYLNNELKETDFLGSQKLDKDIKGVRFNEYCVVLPPPVQVYSPPKKDLSWIGKPEFIDDTVTNYTRLTPSIDVSKSVSKEQEERWKSNHPSFVEQRGSSGNVVLRPMIKFVKESGCPNATKVNNTENARKLMKYAEMYRNISQSLRVRENQRN